MSKNYAKMYSRAWYGDEEITLTFPENWEVTMVAPNDAPKLSDAAVEAAIRSGLSVHRVLKRWRAAKAMPLSSLMILAGPRLRRRSSRYLLRELHQAGIPKNEIRFVVGPGSHRPLTDEEIVKKVGADIAASYEVTNHDFMSGNLRALGNLDEGMPIYINPVVADADFKICLGGIYPHKAVGFGGGAKLIVPGVSGFFYNVPLPQLLSGTRSCNR